MKRKDAFLLNHTTKKQLREIILEKIEDNGVKLLFLAPEQLQNEETREALEKANVVRVVVDEAHVLPEYERGLRPAYGKIGEWIKTLGRRPQILTFSATVTRKDMVTIQESLGMKDVTLHRYSIRRENLKLSWKEVDNDSFEVMRVYRYHGIQDYLTLWKEKKKKGTSAVIYCATKRDVEDLGAWLQVRGWKAGIYHGQIKDEEKIKAMNAFMQGLLPIMVATNAFGLGVDKPDITLVIHAAPPISLENYIQEIGRGGRDGRKAECVMFYAEKDWNKCKGILQHRNLDGLEALQDLVKTGKFSWEEVEEYFSRSTWN